IKLTNCFVTYQKISESGDDMLYRLDYVDGIEAKNNSSNGRGHWLGGFPPTISTTMSSNILLQENNIKATNYASVINSLSTLTNILADSYINIEIAKGSNLTFVYKSNKLNYINWVVSNNISN